MPLLGTAPAVGCWLLGCSRLSASRLAEDAEKGRLSCSCAQAELAAQLAAAVGGRQVPGPHPAAVEPPPAWNDCRRSPSSWTAAASALGRPPAPSSPTPRLVQAASMVNCCPDNARPARNDRVLTAAMMWEPIDLPPLPPAAAAGPAGARGGQFAGLSSDRHCYCSVCHPQSRQTRPTEQVAIAQ